MWFPKVLNVFMLQLLISSHHNRKNMVSHGVIIENILSCCYAFMPTRGPWFPAVLIENILKLSFNIMATRGAWFSTELKEIVFQLFL